MSPTGSGDTLALHFPTISRKRMRILNHIFFFVCERFCMLTPQTSDAVDFSVPKRHFQRCTVYSPRLDEVVQVPWVHRVPKYTHTHKFAHVVLETP